MFVFSLWCVCGGLCVFLCGDLYVCDVRICICVVRSSSCMEGGVNYTFIALQPTSSVEKARGRQTKCN